MTPEFYNSATIRAPGALFEKGRGWARVPLRVRWGFIEHPDLGPTLIDTGYGPTVYGPAPKSFGLNLYRRLFHATLRPEGQIDAVLAQKGLGVDDVQTVIISHLHADHVSELKRFPNARLIGSKRAYEAVKATGWQAPLKHGTFTELLPDDFAARLDDVEGLPSVDLPDRLGQGFVIVPDLLSAVPLEGHAVGHFGLLFHEPNYLYAVDAHWVLTALEKDEPVTGMPKQIADDVPAAEATLARLRGFLAKGGQVGFAHDPNPDPFDAT
jgi:glyoxylase-like metal-dependent hydrolase (beta-lactamase superfamily II)